MTNKRSEMSEQDTFLMTLDCLDNKCKGTVENWECGETLRQYYFCNKCDYIEVG